jgi:hypothetical protein
LSQYPEIHIRNHLGSGRWGPDHHIVVTIAFHLIAALILPSRIFSAIIVLIATVFAVAVHPQLFSDWRSINVGNSGFGRGHPIVGHTDANRSLASDAAISTGVGGGECVVCEGGECVGREDLPAGGAAAARTGSASSCTIHTGPD